MHALNVLVYSDTIVVLLAKGRSYEDKTFRKCLVAKDDKEKKFRVVYMDIIIKMHRFVFFVKKDIHVTVLYSNIGFLGREIYCQPI